MDTLLNFGSVVLGSIGAAGAALLLGFDAEDAAVAGVGGFCIGSASWPLLS